MTADVTGSLFDRGSSVGGPVKIESDQIRLADLEKKNVIFGRPGTGKTTAIVHIIEEYLTQSENARKTKILYLTYSRAMAKVARERLNLDKNTVGTLHSVFSRRLGWRKSNDPAESDFLSDEDISEFAEHYGIRKMKKARPWDEEPSDEEDEWSRFMLTYDSAKNRLSPIKLSAFPGMWRFDPDFVAEKYEEMKKEKGKHDYTDILVAAKNVDFPPLDILVVDEAQDLTPLMWSIIEGIAAPSRTVIYAGDDLQSIYKFRGADPTLFLAQRDGAKVFHLRTSHRMPIEVKVVSDGVAMRIRVKEEVQFEPSGKHGQFHESGNLDSVLSLPGPKFILCRTRWLAEQVADELLSRNVVFVPLNQRHQGLSPWSWSLIRLSNTMSMFPDIPEEAIPQLVDVLQELPASMLVRGVKTAAVNHDYKQIIRMMYEPLAMKKNPLRLFKGEPSTDEVIRAMSIPEGKKGLLLSYLGKKINEQDVVRVDTYHASKGLEARSVGVVLDITEKVMEGLEEDPDSELRNLYVALTRSMENLVVLNLHIGAGVYDV